MPKVRKKKLRKVKRRRKGGNPGIFILTGFICCFLIWIIIKEPADKNSELSKAETVSKNSELPVKPKKKTKKEVKAISPNASKILPKDKKSPGNHYRQYKKHSRIGNYHNH